MKIFRKILILFILSAFIVFLILILFSPILTAKKLIFPYSIHPFDIVNRYPKIWFYIKTSYCFNLFVTVFLTLNSISKFFKFEKKRHKKNNSTEVNVINKNNLNLLVGINPDTQKQVFIPEKGLYQNILVTGTIGSRENKFSIVSIFRTINKI